MKISSEIFRGCENLTEIVLSNSVTEIGHEAFRGCESLTSVIILGSLRAIGEDIFSDCPNVKKIFYRASGNNFEELLRLKSGNTASLIPYYKLIVSEDVQIISEPLIVIGKDKFYAEKVYLKNAMGKTFWINIVDGTFKGFTFSTVEKDTFKITNNVDKTSLNIDEDFWWSVENNVFSIGGVNDIQKYVTHPPWKEFQNSIKKIILMEGIIEIPSKAFIDCSNVEEITLPTSVKDIGDFAFRISFCGNPQSNSGRNVFWCLEDGILIIKKNPDVKDVDADFSIGIVSWKVADKNIRAFKLESDVVLNKIFLDWVFNQKHNHIRTCC